MRLFIVAALTVAALTAPALRAAAQDATPAPPVQFAVITVAGDAPEVTRDGVRRYMVEQLTAANHTATGFGLENVLDPAKQGSAMCARANAQTLLAGSIDAQLSGRVGNQST